MRVESVLAIVAGLAGAAVGLVAGLIARGLAIPEPGRGGCALVIAVGVVAEGVWLRLGRPAPWSVRRQVPQTWSRIFGPGTVAVLYGARLGAGPLTVLTTWWWWAALAVSASSGPFAAAAVGATFGVTRALVMRLAVVRAGAAVAHASAGAGPEAGSGRTPMSVRIQRVQALDRPVARLGFVVVVALLVVVVAACSDPARPTLSAASIPPTTATPTTTTRPITAGSEAATPATTIAATVGVASTPDPTTEVATQVTVPAIPLDQLLLGDEVPATMAALALVPDGQPGTGALDIVAAAAAEQDQQAERSLLETRRFLRGEQRTWQSSDPAGPRVYTLVYEFADRGGAGAYLLDGREHLAARGAGMWDVADIDGATGFTQVDPAGPASFVAHGVAFSRDRWFFLVVASGTDPATVATLATAQARHATNVIGTG